MATKYNDIIKLRGGKAAYNIENEKSGEWTSFIPNDQFNNVLRTVIKSVRGNDIDNHKSFWINGTYGTGKSHAVAVISHILSDDVADLRKWVDYEYSAEKYASLRSAIYSLREEKRLLPVKVSGLNSMTHASDMALVLQKTVQNTLWANDIKVCVPTDFETYIDQIKKNPEIWDHLIESNTQLSSIVASREELVDNLEDDDLKTFHCVSEVLRKTGLDVRMDNNNVKQWFIEIQEELRKQGTYNGLLIVWDEFTDVMTDAIGLPILKELQDISEKFMNAENDSFLFLISHPSAFDKLGSEQLKQTDGRYHRMKYNMESVSAFKIMSRKFEVIDKGLHDTMRSRFYSANSNLLSVFTRSSNDPQSTRDDLFNLFPLHPGTANLATHYATVVGSSSRSVFEFLGQNDAIRDFLDGEDYFLNRDTISADFLWDYVVKVFQDDVQNYGAVTERFNSYEKTVANKGAAYFAIFKGILLLNAFNNVSGENNNGLITPSEENIHYLFDGTRYADEIDTVLEWFNTDGIIQRAPGGLYSVQFSALPSGEIEDKKNEMRRVYFKLTSKIIDFASEEAKSIVEKKMMQKVTRPYEYKFYSDVENDSSLRSQIKNGRKATKGSSYFFAILVSRNNSELATLRNFAEKCATDTEDKDLKNIIFIVLDAVFGDSNYERFIEYQANYACASSHGFVDQTVVHRNHAISMVKDWLEAAQRGNATIYINGAENQPISMKYLPETIKTTITLLVFPYAPDAHARLRQMALSTFWKANPREMVRTFLFATSKADFQNLTSQMKPILHLLQDCLDDNLDWKKDVPEGHPFKMVFDKINSTIKYADKSLPFNFDDKFSYLTKPPYGLYKNCAAMGMVAFALRPWVNKIFDPQGKPRDANALIDDVVLLFKVWDEGGSNAKLNFKFQTQEEGKLCKDLISLFGLGGANSIYKDVTSLKDARYAITADFLGKRKTPLWALKYAPQSVFESLPGKVAITDDMKRLIDNIVTICSERDLRNPALINETLALIGGLRFEMTNLFKVEAAFTEGFKEYLKQVPYVNVQDSETENLWQYIEKHLESTVGYWTAEEVEKTALQWRASLSTPAPTQPTSVAPIDPANPSVDQSSADPVVVDNKRDKAKSRIADMNIDDAKALLMKLCERGNEWVLDMINN